MLKILALFILLAYHPVHVTITSIDHVPDSDSLKVFVRMYYDDFLLDYKLFDQAAAIDDIIDDQSFPMHLMNKYIDKKVIIVVNNKELKGKLLNLILSLPDNEISMNLLYRTDKKPEIITVRNEIMTGLYDDQANMTIVRMDDLEEGVKLTPYKTEQTFSLR
jgi:hypothetical protein